MNNYHPDTDTLSCTLGGTLLVLLYSVQLTALLDTVVIAATGAIVSFIVSLLCKFIWRKIREG